MYCKKCGRKLDDSARFCDRCGQMAGTAPPRQKPQSKKPQNGQNRDSYSEYRKKKMQIELEAKRRKKKIRILIVWVAIITLIATIGGFFFGQAMIEPMNQNAEVQTEQPEKSTEISTEKTVSSKEEESPSKDESSSKDENTANPDIEVYIDNVYDFKCPCPSSFEKGTLANNNTRLSLSDPDGDGTMLICCEKISASQSATTLMREYVKGIGVKDISNKAGENWYEVTFTRNSKTNHRKSIIIDSSTYMYYDFSYNSASDNKAKYEEFIEYADNYLDKQYKTKTEDSE